MAHGSPDWVRAIQVSVNIGDVTIVPTTTQQRAAGGVGRYSGSSTDYVEVKSWTVATGKVGELKEISLASTTLSHVYWKVTVGSVTWLTAQVLDAILTIPFADLLLVAGTVVKVEVYSDGASINASVSIVGKEMG